MNQNSSRTLRKECQVCGDEANAFNYNGLTCKPCKMFFLRNFDRFNELECKKPLQSCKIDPNSRSLCPRCRLVKCFWIGMRLDTIGKRRCRTAKQLAQNNDNNLNQLICWRINQSLQKDDDELFENYDNNFETIQNYFIPKSNPDQLTPAELEIIREIRQAAMLAFTDETKLQVSRVAHSNTESFNLYANYVRKIIKFCKNIQGFKALSPADQLTTLKGVFFDIAIIRRIYQYNQNHDEIRLLGNETGDFTIVVCYTGISEESFHGMDFKKHEFFEKFKTSLHSFMENDEILRDLIIGKMLFRPRDRITCPEYVNYEHKIYSRLLRRYLYKKSSNVATAEENFYILICLLDKLDQFKAYLLEFILAQIDVHQVDEALKEMFEI